MLSCRVPFTMNEPIKWSKDIRKLWFYDDFTPWGFTARERRRFQQILSERAEHNLVFDGNETQLKIHSIIAPLIRDYFQWKNVLFLANDDIAPLVYEYDMGLSLVAVDLILFLETTFHFEFNEKEAVQIFSTSYGDFLNYLIAQKKNENDVSTPALPSFE